MGYRAGAVIGSREKDNVAGLCLDVYKRQAQHIIFFLLFPARHSGIAGLCQKELVRHGGRITFISGDIPVSYTHLDVYKRQVQNDAVGVATHDRGSIIHKS